MPAFHGLDKALRWLRIQAHRKQREVAEAAGITQAMLCSYEQGKRVPSLASLEKILDSLGADLGRLAEVLAIVAGEAVVRRPRPLPPILADPGAAGSKLELPDVRAILGATGGLPAGKEAALQQLLDGFCEWLRVLNTATPEAPAGERQTEPNPPRRSG
jgi:transcriptional regulator with XRE-family HTH domain